MISYRIFLNERLDPQGRHEAWGRFGQDAYQPGDKLVLAKTIETHFTTMPDAEDHEPARRVLLALQRRLARLRRDLGPSFAQHG